MMSNFALSLSADGLRLMLRVEDGWHLVDEVPASSPDLPAAMGRLRRRATELAPQLRTKLLIPNDQVRYLALDDPRASDEDVCAALAEAQPMAVEELVWDVSHGGGRTYVAAVARETLEEAEAFAAGYRFQPVSFAAVPPPFTFRGEPFFGASRLAATLLEAGEEVVRDPGPVVVTGEVARAEPPPEAAPASAPLPPPPEEAVFGSRRTAGKTPDRLGADKTSERAESEDAGAEPVEPAEPIVFASRTRAALTPTASEPAAAETAVPEPAAPDLAVPEPAAPEPPAPEAAEPPPPPPQPASGLREPPAPVARLRAVPPSPPSLLPARIAPEAPSAGTPAPIAASRGGGPALAARLLPVDDEDLDIPLQPQPFLPPPPAPGTVSPLRALFHSRRKPQDPEAARRAAQRAAEAERMAIIGRAAAAKKAQVGGKPRFLGPVLVLVLILVMAAVAALAARTDVIGRLFGAGTGETTLADAPAAGPGPAIEGIEAPDAPTDPEAAASAPAVPEPPAAAPASSDPALLEPASPEPDVPPEPDDAVVPDSPPPAVDPEVEDAGTARAELDPPGTVLSPAEADRFYAATGVWVRAERLPLLPGSETLAAPAVAESPAPAPVAPPVTLALSAPAPDRALPPQRLPPAPGTTLERDARGFILATPEGTLTPDGMMIYARAPSVEPPTRPGTEPPAAAASPETTEPQPDATEEATATPGTPDAATGPEGTDPDGTAAPAPPETTESQPEATEEATATPGSSDAAGGPEGNDPDGTADDAPPETTEPQPEATGAAGTPDAAAGPDGTGADGTAAAEVPLARDAAGSAAADPATEDARAGDTDATVLIEGAPPVVPPTRPGTELPDAAADEASAPVDDTDALDVVAGPPPLVPPTRPGPVAGDAAATASAPEVTVGSPSLVPPTRPATPGAIGLDALTGALETALAPLPAYQGRRPDARPEGLAPEEIAAAEPEPEFPAAPDLDATLAGIMANAPDPLAGATPQAVARASRPDSRPRNFAQVVSRAVAAAPRQVAAAQPAQPSGPTTGEPVSNAAARPTGPTPGGVAAAATRADAMNLRQTNLIGVYGRPNDRRALVRLSNGRYVRVSIGDSLEGGRVTAINDNALNYVVRGQTYALQIPN